MGDKISQILSKLRYIRLLKRKKPELYELNSLWHDELMLLQELQRLKNELSHPWLKPENGIHVQYREETEILTRKIPRVTPETYPCGVLIQPSEG